MNLQQLNLTHIFQETELGESEILSAKHCVQANLSSVAMTSPALSPASGHLAPPGGQSGWVQSSGFHRLGLRAQLSPNKTL